MFTYVGAFINFFVFLFLLHGKKLLAECCLIQSPHTFAANQLVVLHSFYLNPRAVDDYR